MTTPKYNWEFGIAGNGGAEFDSGWDDVIPDDMDQAVMDALEMWIIDNQGRRGDNRFNGDWYLRYFHDGWQVAEGLVTNRTLHQYCQQDDGTVEKRLVDMFGTGHDVVRVLGIRERTGLRWAL